MRNIKIFIGKLTSLLVTLAMILPFAQSRIVFAADEGYILDELGDKSKLVSSDWLEFKTFDTDKFGDYTRAVATTGSKGGTIVYDSDGFKKIEVVLYRNPQGGDLLFYTGQTQTGEWNQIASELISSRITDTQGGWEKVVYTFNNINNDKYFKLLWYDPDLGPNLHTQGYMGIYSSDTWYYKSQLGAVIRYTDENASVAETVAVKNSLVMSFNDDFANLNNWDISSIYSGMVSAKKVDGKTCAVFDTADSKFKCKPSDPYIKSADFTSGYDTYEINLSLKTDSNMAERTLALKTAGEDGSYVYPICFGKDGTIGVKTNNNVFTDFAEPYDYSADIWYDVKIIINTKSAVETVYINNVNVTPQPITLLEGGATTGISEIRFSHIDKKVLAVKTYLDSLTISRGYSLDFTSNIYGDDFVPQSVEVNDIYYHWAAPTVKSLVSTGIISCDENENFNPDDNINVDEFIKLVINCGGVQLTTSENWADTYIAEALEKGIVKEGEFASYNVPIARYQMARILARAAYGEPNYQPSYNYTDDIKDFNSIPEDYKPCVLAVYSKGIMSGDGNGNFNPLNNATRAEAACVIQRFLEPNLRQYAHYTIGIYAENAFSNVTQSLVNAFEDQGYCYKILTKENMAEQDVLNADSIDCLVLLNNLEQDDLSAEVFREFTEDGGDIVLAGEDIRNSLSTQAFRIPVFGSPEEIDIYHLKDIATIKASDESNQDIIPMNFTMSGSWNGIAAVGYEHNFRSTAIPVLKAYDAYGKELGYAAGVLVNYGTHQAHSNILYYGINELSFYESAGFTQSVTDTLSKFASGELDSRWSYREEYQRNFDAVMNYQMTQPKPANRVRISDDGKRFIDVNGKEMVLNGANTLGNSTYTFNAYGKGYGQFSIEKTEAYFKKMNELGINCIRLWNTARYEYGGEYCRQVTNVIKDMARKYGVYIQLNGVYGGVGYDNNNVQASLNEIDAIMTLWANEPMLIGYDYGNEPDLASMIYQFGIYGDAPLDKYDIYNEYKDILTAPDYINTWNAYTKTTGNTTRMKNVLQSASCTDNRFLQTAALLCLFLKDDERFVTGTNKLYNGHLNGIEWKASDSELFSVALNEIIDNGLKAIKNRIKKWDPDCMFTIGFDCAGSVIPAMQDYLDYWNPHVYRTIDPPYPMEKTIKQFTSYDTFDSLNENIPAVYGEFSPRAGNKETYGSTVQMTTNETADVINLFSIVYPYSKGYGGGLVWEFEQRIPWAYNFTNKSTYGMELLSGNSDPEHYYMDRMFGYLMRFFKKFTDREGTIGTGNMEWFKADTQCDTGFKFVSDTCEYVYADKYTDNRMSFEVGKDDARPVVMLDWGNGVLDIMSTAKAKVQINLPDCLNGVTAETIKLDGYYKSYTLTGNALEIELLDNATVTVSK